MDNRKYKLLDISLSAMNKKAFNLLVVRGAPGMGKTHKILNFVKEKGIDYTYIKTYSTPLKFYELLYKNRGKRIIIFDDLSNIGDPKILGMLKSACWSVLGEDRGVDYYTTSRAFKKLEIPEKFKMESSIILIFNETIPNFEPVMSRGVNIDFNFTFPEKLSILKEIGDGIGIDGEIIKYTEEICSEATKNLSIRSLAILSKIKEQGFDWEIFADEILKVDEELQLLLNLVSSHLKLKDACSEWMLQTGKSRSTFMRLLRSIKKNEEN